MEEPEATRITNRRLGSKLHRLYSIAVEKRSLIAYDDKRVIRANLPNAQPNPNTHAFGHYFLNMDFEVVNKGEAEAGADLYIEERLTRDQSHEKRLQQKQASPQSTIHSDVSTQQGNEQSVRRGDCRGAGLGRSPTSRRTSSRWVGECG